MPIFRLILFCCMVFTTTCWAQTTTTNTPFGAILHVKDFKSAYIGARNLEIFVPSTYFGKKRMGVLYMHDGQMLFDSTQTWNHQSWDLAKTLGQLIENGEVPPTMIVGIWNGDKLRFTEYFPERPFYNLPTVYRDSLLKMKHLFQAPISSDAYLKFIVEELKPFIDKHFRTKRDKKFTYIAGSSMGGLISMYAMAEYPDVFGGAACLSTHWPGIFNAENNPIPAAFEQYLISKKAATYKNCWYFDTGTATLDAMYLPFQQNIDRLFEGHKNGCFMSKVFEGEDHSEKAWAKRSTIFLKFLLNNCN